MSYTMEQLPVQLMNRTEYVKSALVLRLGDIIVLATNCDVLKVSYRDI